MSTPVEFSFRITGDLDSEEFMKGVAELRAVILQKVIETDHNDLEIRITTTPFYRQPTYPMPRINYHNPLRYMPPIPETKSAEFIVSTREEAERVLEMIGENLAQATSVSSADVKELLGLPYDHSDSKLGWTTTAGMEIQEVREGWALILTKPQEID